jgi:hypothetical protein
MTTAKRNTTCLRAAIVQTAWRSLSVFSDEAHSIVSSKLPLREACGAVIGSKVRADRAGRYRSALSNRVGTLSSDALAECRLWAIFRGTNCGRISPADVIGLTEVF